MRRVPAVLAVLALSLAVVPPVAAAESRVGAGVVVESGERVDGLTATGGVVRVEGTVDGDLEAYGGRVVVAEGGTVTGDVSAYAGLVRVEGTVEGRVIAYGGRVVGTATSTVRRSFGAVAGVVTVAGTVTGDVTAVAGRLRVAPTAVVRNDLNYEGRFERDAGATVEGRTRRIREVGPAPPSFPPAAVFLYGLLGNLLLGAILLYVGRMFSADVVETAVLDPVPSLGHGLALVVGAPLVVLALALTVVGAPVALAGLLALPLLGWIGAVYGRLAVGAWLLSFTDVETPFAGLAVGVVLVGLLARLPYAGPVVRVLVLAAGIGALVIELRSRLGDETY
ncbi:MAG: polymer-forming cytoskeletal protein [Haloferacaceae archaeon]